MCIPIFLESGVIFGSCLGKISRENRKRGCFLPMVPNTRDRGVYPFPEIGGSMGVGGGGGGEGVSLKVYENGCIF